MKYDFWNNPIVVSAFRVKYRRGGLSSTLLLYVGFLALGGAAMQYYSLLIGGNWQHKYFVALMILQFLASVFIACISTAASIRSEVVNRTLDFQRIATLSPTQILWGKLLGEPALAYLLLVASFPMAVWCWLLGGPPLDVILLMYLNLACATFMAGSFGLANRLEGGPSKPNTNYAGGEGAVFGIIAALALNGGLVYGLVEKDFRKPAIPVFGVEVPLAFLLPPCELLLAILPFKIMVRQLINPQNPMLGKRTAYMTLFFIDLLAAAVLSDPGIWGPVAKRWYFGSRCAAFCLIHLVASGILMSLITPRGETVESWMWRFRKRQQRLADWWAGERSPNVVAMLTFAGMLALSWTLLLWLPARLREGPTIDTEAMRIGIPSLLATIVFIVAGGIMTQLINFLPGKRRMLASNAVNLLIFIPWLVGKGKDYYPVDWIIAFSPIDHYKNWLNPGLEPLNVIPLLILYSLIAVGLAFWLFGLLERKQKTVNEKLTGMGLQPAIA